MLISIFILSVSPINIKQSYKPLVKNWMGYQLIKLYFIPFSWLIFILSRWLLFLR